MTSAFSAKEAREISLKNSQDSVLFKNLFSSIMSEAQLGNNYLNYYTNGKHFEDKEIERIKELGYSICWNGPCLWYGVSW